MSKAERKARHKAERAKIRMAAYEFALLVASGGAYDVPARKRLAADALDRAAALLRESADADEAGDPAGP